MFALNLRTFLVLLVFFSTTNITLAKQTLVIAGAGPSTEIVAAFFTAYANSHESQYQFEVPRRSIKHAGGISHSDFSLFGRTGRPLSEAEKQGNKGEILLASIPLTFVGGSDTGIRSLTHSQLIDILDRKIKDWKLVGGKAGQIVLAGRENTEASFNAIAIDLPMLKNVGFDLILSRDHHMVKYIESPEGAQAIGFGARANFKNQNVIDVSGFRPSVPVGLVYDLSNQQHPLVKSVKAFVQSDEWHAILQQHGWNTVP